LAEISEDLVLTERVNVMTVLTAVALSVKESLPSEAAKLLVKSLRAFEVQGQYDSAHLPGVLEIALCARDEALVDGVLGRDELWAELENLRTLAQRWGSLPSLGQSRLERELAAALPEDPSLLAAVLSLPEQEARSALASDDVRRALADAYASTTTSSGQQFVDVIVEILLDTGLQEPRRPAQLAESLALLDPSESTSYVSIKDRRVEISQALRPHDLADWILRTWTVAPMEDTTIWADLLESVPLVAPTDRALPVINRFFSEWDDVPAGEKKAIASRLGKLAGFCEPDDDTVHDFVASLEAALTPSWTTEPEAAERIWLHAGARAVQVLGTRTSERVETLLTADIVSRLGTPLTEPARYAVEEMVASLGSESILTVAEATHQFDPESQPDETVQELTLRAGLALLLRDAGEAWQGPPMALSYGDELRHVILRSAAKPLLERWLRLAPPANLVRVVLSVHSRQPTQAVLDSLDHWAGSRTKKQRTASVVALLAGNAHPDFIRIIVQRDVVQIELARTLVKLIAAEPKAGARTRMADKTSALGLSSTQARTVISDAAIKLLNGPTKSDVSVAEAMISGIGKSPPKQPSLEKALASAVKRHKYKFREDEARRLRDAGIAIPSESLGKRIRKRLRL
jgi:hypothetical protein